MRWVCKDYVRGTRFVIHTDHRPLIWMMQGVAKENCGGRVFRWFHLLSQFSYEIVHVPGKENILADALSMVSAIGALGLDDEPQSGGGEDLPIAPSTAQHPTLSTPRQHMVIELHPAPTNTTAETVNVVRAELEAALKERGLAINGSKDALRKRLHRARRARDLGRLFRAGGDLPPRLCPAEAAAGRPRPRVTAVQRT